MHALRYGYRVVRSILFAAVLIVAGLYIVLYLLISIPGIQSKIKDVAERELTKFFKAPASIESLEILPFNEVRITGFRLLTPKHEKCIEIEKVGAGIALWSLITDGPVEITYTEIIGLKARISQEHEGEDLNIQFIIDAFKPKKNGRQTKFDLKLHNIVIRKSDATFDRQWIARKNTPAFDANHIYIKNLRADIAVPILKNDNYKIDLRRLSFHERSGFYIDDLSFIVGIDSEQLSLTNFKLKLKEGYLTINNQKIPIEGITSIGDKLKNRDWHLQIEGNNISTEELAGFFPPINNIPGLYGFRLFADGRPENIDIRKFQIYSHDEPLNIEFTGLIKGLPDINGMSGKIDKLSISGNSSAFHNIVSLFPGHNQNIIRIMDKAGNINLNMTGGFRMAEKSSDIQAALSSSLGEINVDGHFNWKNKSISASGNIVSSGFRIGELLDNQPVAFFSGDLEGEVFYSGKDIEGTVTLNADRVDVAGKSLQNIYLNATKENKFADLKVSVNCPLVVGQMVASCIIDNENSQWNVRGKVENVDDVSSALLPGYAAKWSVGNIVAELSGNNPDNLSGHISIDDINCRPVKGDEWNIRALRIASVDIKDYRKILLTSDLINGEITGKYKYSNIVKDVKRIVAYSLPYFIKNPGEVPDNEDYVAIHLEIKPARSFYRSLNIGFLPLRQITVNGSFKESQLEMDIDAPLIGQGRGKLKYIRDSHIRIEGDIAKGLSINGQSRVPVKNGEVDASIKAGLYDNSAEASFGWTNAMGNGAGSINLAGCIREKPDVIINAGKMDLPNAGGHKSPEYELRILDSDIELNGSKWKITPGAIRYYDELLSIDNIRIANDSQYVDIRGRASRNPTDTISVYMNDIDLSYIFDTLNINYVTFGGSSTGKAVASNIFSKKPYATTEGLYVRNLSYNNAVIGDGNLLGYWDNENKAVGIQADINGGKDIWTKVRGNVYVTRDSLGIDFNAHKTNIALIRPFLENVLEKVEGQASCDLTLYGTFKDITLIGKAFADTASVKIGFTNVTYHGSDSVIFLKDRIIIPGFKVQDMYGNTANFNGTVKHDYFHDAYIDFNISDIDKLLCLDMDSRQSPVWYGKIFASGSGKVSGVPGYTRINFNVTTDPKSEFTFVIDDTQTAMDYTFLTFSDKRKEAMAINIEDSFRAIPAAEEQEDNSLVELDLGVGITEGVKMNVIMDPSAGDKITADGKGAMRIHYDSKGDKLDMYGRYSLSEGNYQFSFQDLILRDFKIRPGSSVMFNGDPLAGILNITASYRVNANLSDLDKSFSTDPDLNRSSVPVEALLKVSGPLSTPDIAFDIALPTVTGDVERKVRSIVSSEEMLNQQVLYLLALNRFYTPQFAGSSEGDLMSVASSTLSSQISNILSQITDKVSLNPSFKSDRNDFSDMEVDLALSSQLFDNRLIINGNLGYRDRSISNTNFIGDFDIEYLLNKRGNFRLKAYNHFNDAYYYLKSALTTQGIGIIYRKDFDDAFAFLRHKPKWMKKITVAKDRRYNKVTNPDNDTD